MTRIELPVIILKGIILLPNNDIRLEFDNDISRDIIDASEMFHECKVFIVSNENSLEETIDINRLAKYGVVARISHRIELPNGKTRLIISGIKRAKVVEYLDINKGNNILEAIVTPVEDIKLDSKEEDILIKKLNRELDFYTKAIPYVSNGIIEQAKNSKNLEEVTDIVVPFLDIEKTRLMSYLKEENSVERLTMILEDIYNETEVYQIEKQIDNKVKKNLDDNQRQYILKEKLKEIKKELGDSSIKENEIEKLKNKASKLKLNSKLQERFEEEISRLEAMTDSSPEVNVVRNYVEWLLNIPWNKYTTDNDDLDSIMKKLNETHSGLEELKERFIEYVAVRKQTNNIKSPIICLVGPPGVGKTSFVKALANALNRNFVKVSVGGINDEAEIVGHRRTYLGANPGRIIQSLKKAKSMNPVFLIDEIDKMTKDQKGDPASALLDVLDPEQNKFFSDNYIEEEVDLSDIMFITTANDALNIPEPLRDRMEIIELSGYTEFEKLEIAKKYIIPKTCKEHGIDYNNIKFDDYAILFIIREYTKESGVRELDRIISKIIRKIVTSLYKNKIKINKLNIDKDLVLKYLGQPIYTDNFIKHNEIGVVNGLAYTPYGGDTLKIEVNYYKGTGKLNLTGCLGEVMMESAKIALAYVKANYKHFGIDYKLFKDYDLHIHVPEGAVKKDGPSAGIAITTALVSALTNSRVDSTLAMTGEITLRGNVLKIGGLKEKSIGALRCGINKIIIPKTNVSDLEKLPSEVLTKITFIPVSNYMEAYKIMRRGFNG